MKDLKLSVSIILQGRIPLTQVEAEQFEEEKEGSGFNTSVIKINTGRNKFKTYIIKTCKKRTVTQTINMYEEAFEYMTGTDSCPEGINMGLWKRMRKKQRLEAHLERLCESLGGISYTYKVFDN